MGLLIGVGTTRPTNAFKEYVDENFYNKTDTDGLLAEKVDTENVPQVVSNLSVNAGASSVGLNVTITNPATGDETQTSTPLPIASETQMGLMPFESFKQIATNTAAIESLKGVGRVAAHLGTTPAQADISAAWTAAKGENIPDGATVVNLDQDSPAGHAWTYLSTSPEVFEWVDRGTDTVNQASNAAPGIVKGTDGVNGKVFIENDGTMSVVGWDGMPTQSEIDAAIEQAVSDHNVDETAHPDIRALIAADSGGFTALTKNETINTYSFPSSGMPPDDAPFLSVMDGLLEILIVRNPTTTYFHGYVRRGVNSGNALLDVIAISESGNLRSGYSYSLSGSGRGGYNEIKQNSYSSSYIPAVTRVYFSVIDTVTGDISYYYLIIHIYSTVQYLAAVRKII